MTAQTLATTRVTLRSEQVATIRPLDGGDRQALLDFGRALPQHDLLYLEDDFQSPEIITRLVNAHQAENWRQIVAEADGGIVGYSAARRLTGWSSHVAEITLLVKGDWRRSGLGVALAQAIFDAARDLGATKVIVEMLEQQRSGQAIFERLGFRVEGTLMGHARDRQGQARNLLILAYHVS
jgi:RimJ/RimL family protein N-acetyltransferase